MNGPKKKTLSNPEIQDGIAVLVLGVALLIYSLFKHYTARVQTEWKMSPYLFPVLISVFAILLAFSLFADGRRVMASEEKKKDSGSLINFKRVVMVALMAVVYEILMNITGYIPATVVFLMAMIRFFGEKRWWMIVVIAVATSLIIYLLFGILLNVRFP